MKFVIASMAAKWDSERSNLFAQQFEIMLNVHRRTAISAMNGDEIASLAIATTPPVRNDKFLKRHH